LKNVVVWPIVHMHIIQVLVNDSIDL